MRRIFAGVTDSSDRHIYLTMMVTARFVMRPCQFNGFDKLFFVSRYSNPIAKIREITFRFRKVIPFSLYDGYQQ